LTIQAKEYVIERPDTPRSWANYLGSKEYGAIITNNGGRLQLPHVRPPRDGPHAAAVRRPSRPTSRAGIYTSATRNPATTGPMPGSPSANRSTSTKPPAATALPTRSSIPSIPRLKTETHLFRSAGQTFRVLAAEGHEPRRRQKKAEPVHLRRIPQLRTRLQRLPQPAILARHREDGFRGRHH